MAKLNIFISYNRQSEDVVKGFAEDLEALGHNIWFDQELSGGQAWWDRILAEVRSCDIFVFLLTQVSLNSNACKLEYKYADDLGKPILPVLVDEEVSTNLLPPALSQIQFIDYLNQDRDAIIHLARALNTIPPPKPLPDPLPHPPEVPISYLGNITEQVATTSTLSYEEQSVLVVDLKRGMRDPEINNDDARTLLKRLRKRRDLFAAIAEEIDELLGNLHEPFSASKTSSEEKISTPKPSQKEGSRPSSAKSKTPDKQPALTDSDNPPTKKERLKGAFIMAAIGAVAGILCITIFSITFGYYWKDVFFNYQFLYLPMGIIVGAVSGIISGKNRGRLIAALTGMGISVILAGFNYPYTYSWLFLYALLSPIGAYIKTLSNKRVEGAFFMTAFGVVSAVLASIFSDIIIVDKYYHISEYFHHMWYSFALGGIVAGVVSGMNRTRMIAALIGMGVAAVLSVFIIGYGFILSKIIAFFFPIIAISILYIYKRIWRK